VGNSIKYTGMGSASNFMRWKSHAGPLLVPDKKYPDSLERIEMRLQVSGNTGGGFAVPMDFFAIFSANPCFLILLARTSKY